MTRNGKSRAREGPGPNGFGSPGRSTDDDITPAKGTGAAAIVTDALARLLELHYRGYLTRAELEREYGVPYPVLLTMVAAA